MADWMPIETAPRDGTPVIVLIDGDAIQAAFDEVRGQDGKVYYAGWSPIVLLSHGCGCCGNKDPLPTHWMPLPPPPATGKPEQVTG